MNQGRPSHSPCCSMSSAEKGGKTGKDRGAAVNFSILLTDADEDDALGRVSFGMAGYTCSSGLWT